MMDDRDMKKWEQLEKEKFEILWMAHNSKRRLTLKEKIKLKIIDFKELLIFWKACRKVSKECRFDLIDFYVNYDDPHDIETYMK